MIPRSPPAFSSSSSAPSPPFPPSAARYAAEFPFWSAASALAPRASASRTTLAFPSFAPLSKPASNASGPTA